MGFYILQGEEKKGPYSLGQLRAMWNSGALTMQTRYCEEGSDEWNAMSSLQHELEPQDISRSPARPLLIETTGKKWKSAHFISILMTIGGLLVIYLASRQESKAIAMVGAAISIAGLIVAVIAKAGAWWHHR
jgi:GYF domain 2